MPNPAPSWGNQFLFPLAFEKTGAGRSYRTEHSRSNNADKFDAQQENGLWRFSLGGLKMLPAYVDTWDAFVDALKGQWKPSLLRLMSKRFEIERTQSGGIGSGDGEKTAFQLVKSRSYDYGPDNLSLEIVRFPWHNYPPMTVPVGNSSSGGTLLYATEIVRIWVAGVEKVWGVDFEVDRETGIVTFDDAPANGALVQASCKFFVLVHGQDYYPIESSGGVWVFPSGAELFQVASEAGAI